MAGLEWLVSLLRRSPTPVSLASTPRPPLTLSPLPAATSLRPYVTYGLRSYAKPRVGSPPLAAAAAHGIPAGTPPAVATHASATIAPQCSPAATVPPPRLTIEAAEHLTIPPRAPRRVEGRRLRMGGRVAMAGAECHTAPAMACPTPRPPLTLSPLPARSFASGSYAKPHVGSAAHCRRGARHPCGHAPTVAATPPLSPSRRNARPLPPCPHRVEPEKRRPLIARARGLNTAHRAGALPDTAARLSAYSASARQRGRAVIIGRAGGRLSQTGENSPVDPL